jgi:hypothetical protein
LDQIYALQWKRKKMKIPGHYNTANRKQSIIQDLSKTSSYQHYYTQHPVQHKMSAINFMINRLNTYPANKEDNNAKKKNTIKYMHTAKPIQIKRSHKTKTGERE